MCRKLKRRKRSASSKKGNSNEYSSTSLFNDNVSVIKLSQGMEEK